MVTFKYRSFTTFRLAACAAMLILALLAFCAGAIAGAEEAQRQDLQFIVGENHAQIKDLKQILWDNGYYEGLDYAEIINGDTLDDTTMSAVFKCVNENKAEYPKMEYAAEGVTKDTWWVICGDTGTIKDLTPEEEEEPGYVHILYGDTGDNVDRLQTLLRELGYPVSVTATAKYDEDLEKALDILFEQNDISYDQTASNGLTPEIQQKLLEGEVTLKPYAPPEEEEDKPKPGKMEQMRDWMLEKRDVFNLQVPNLAIVGVIVLLALAIVLAIIHFFVPGKGGQGRGGDIISFKIEYNGKTWDYERPLGKQINIGRAVGKFPLELEDGSISRNHCRIYRLEKDLRLRDFSSYGTTVNGRLVHNSECVLNNGDEIKIGKHVIHIYLNGGK